jgi:DNA-binding transcriptional MerR regulator
MTIGEFARRSRLPVSTLRYYHELGLLLPARVDPATGYRYYERRQLAMAGLIHDLRLAGVAPTAIGDVTSGRRALAEVLGAHERRLQDEIDERVARRAAVRRLQQERLAVAPRGPVRFERRSSRTVPAELGTIDSRSPALGVQRLLVALRRRLRAAAGGPSDRVGADPAFHFGAAFPLDLDGDPIPTTVFAHGVAAGSCPGASFTMPGGVVAAVEVAGRHRLSAGYDALLSVAADHGRITGERVIEEYLVGGEGPITRLVLPLESDVTAGRPC